MKQRTSYMCDGINSCCLGDTPLDQITWFTSRLGFCPHCSNRLHRIPTKVLEFLYEQCDADDEDVINFTIGLTE